MTTLPPGPMAAAHLWIVPFGVAICVRRALRTNAVRSELHWPNDLLTGGKKIAGILCVSRIVGDARVGRGRRRHQRPSSLGADEAISPPPAFCDDVNPSITRATLLRDLLLNYDLWHHILEMPQRIARRMGADGRPAQTLPYSQRRRHESDRRHRDWSVEQWRARRPTRRRQERNHRSCRCKSLALKPERRVVELIQVAMEFGERVWFMYTMWPDS